MAITASQAQGLVLALFGASAGGHLTGLTSGASLSGVAADLVTAAGLVLDKDLSSNTAFRDLVLTTNLKLTGTALTEAQKWMDGEFTKGTARADILAAAVTFLDGLTDTTNAFYSTAAAYRTTVANAVTWSQGAGATVFGVSALMAQQGTAGSGQGQTFVLTNSATADTLIGTSGNDTFTGASGTVVDADTIIDQTTNDADVANLVLTAAYTPANIKNVETVNLDWDAYGTATYALTNVKGAKTVNLTSSKVGYLGSATVTAADAVALVAGAGTVGTLTASGFKTGSVDAGASKTVVVNGSATNTSNVSLSVTANSATSVTVGTTNGAAATTVSAKAATTVAIQDAGNTTDTIDLTVGKDATITNTGTGALTLTAADGNKLSLSAIGASLTVKGAGALTITANGALDTEKVTNSMDAGSTLTLKDNATAATNLSKVQATTIELTGVKAGADTVANGANLKYSGGGAITVTVAGSGTADAVTAELTTASVTSVTSSGVEKLTVKANAPQVSGADLTIATADTGGANTILLTGTNDVVVTALAGASGTLDASGLTGDVTVSGTTVSTSVKGGSGKMSVTSTGTTTDLVAIGQSADDSVTSNATTTGSVTAILGDGKNTVSATGLTTGTLVVTAGSGIDTVSAGAALTTGVINLNLGDGNNVINLSNGAGAGTSVVTTGGGDDTLTILTDLDNDSDVVTFDAGAGTDTLYLSKAGTIDITSKVTVSGLETIKTTKDRTAIVNAKLVDGQTYTVKADGTSAGTTSVFKVMGVSDTATIDLSGLKIDQSITSAINSVVVDASANTTTVQTIKGTAIGDTITGGDKADTITAGNGADTITGGKGNDAIDITEATSDQAADTVVLIAKANNGTDSITGFKSGTDKLSLLGGAESTVVTAAGAAVVDFFSTALVSSATAYAVGTGGGTKTTTTADVVVISTTLSSNGNLDLSSTGAELLKALSSSATAAATGLTVATAADAFYLVAYQNGNAYVYAADAGAANTTVDASELTLVAKLVGVTAGSLGAADFLVQG